MRTRLRSIAWLALAFVFGCASPEQSVSGAGAADRPSGGRPNILVIIADDMAYSDAGAFGGEVRTPNLDALARRGIRLTDFHTAPLCSPSRAMLMTGLDNHRVGLGTMAELQGPQWPAGERLVEGRPGYEGFLSRSVATISERLQAAGYYTAISGKWHLGKTQELSPAARGFARSFVLLNGEGNHYGLDQSPAWRSYPPYTEYREDGELATYPEGIYSADLFTDRMIRFLEAPEASGRPFFAVLSLTQPHWPLQAPEERIASYRGMYEAGPVALRSARLEQMRKLGIIPEGSRVVEVAAPDWRAADLPRREAMTRRMEVHAAMIETMDAQIGRLLASLEESGRLRDTYVVFFSDNGADGSNLESPVRFRGRPLPPELGVDNSVGNVGRGDSYVSYGPEWAEAGMVPATRFKGNVAQGGIRSPAIIAGPGVRAGVSHAFTHILDMPATFAALGLGKIPESFEGRSIAPLFSDPSREIRGENEPVFWEQSYGRAVRAGRWKAVFSSASASAWRLAFDDPSVGWRLYDVEADPGETLDMAERHPDRLEWLVSEWNAYAARSGVFVPPALAERDRPAAVRP